MRLNKKRRSEDEPQSSRASKRQATIPTTRLTRSSLKLNANNGSAVQLNPGLPMAPRQRKKPAPSASIQQRSTPTEVPSRADSVIMSTVLPGTEHVPAPGKSAQQAPTETSSVVYAIGLTPDGREICAPIRMGSKLDVNRQPKMVTTSAFLDHNICTGFCTEIAPGLDAAMPGGPAPIAYMGGEFSIAITYTTDITPHEEARCQNSKRRRREPSHSSGISPRSGPAQVCPIPTSSRADHPCPSWASGSTNTETPGTPMQFKLDWTRLDPDWLNRGDEMWKMPGDEDKPAVSEATYTVASLEEAAELFVNEMEAHSFGRDIESPVDEVFVPEDSQDLLHKETLLTHMPKNSNRAIVECAAGNFSFATIEWTKTEEITKETTEVPDLDSDGAYSGLTSPTKGTEASFPSTRCSSFDCAIEPVTQPTTTVQDSKKILALATAEGFCLPRSQPRTPQRIANLQREKELRERLIEMRRARKAASTQCVQNVLVREADGSMSIITTQDTLVPSWGMEEDQYSVEEYEEDSVSY